MAEADLIADSVVTAAGLLGLGLLAHILSADRPARLTNRRFVLGLHVVGVVMAARLVFWLTDIRLFGLLTYAAAALVPLAALLIAEALTRRHAPVMLKAWTVGGAVLLVFTAFVPWPPYHPLPLVLLAGFQFLSFLSIAALILARDRASLSTAENGLIDRLVLSLVFIISFALTDFRGLLFDSPVRLSGIAVLILCCLALDLRRGEAGRAGLALAAATLVAVLTVTLWSVARIAAPSPAALVQIGAILSSAILAGHAVLSARAIRRGAGRDDLLRFLATDPAPTRDAFLAGLRRTGLATGALILTPDDLADFDLSFRAEIARQGVLRQSDPPAEPHLAEQAAWFFEKFDVTHALMVGDGPLRILALNLPPLARPEQLEHELAVAQRLARLLPAGQARDG
ncbi:MAG: hypothetical protein AAF919_19290 [Pseudomonadota bacterium]